MEHSSTLKLSRRSFAVPTDWGALKVVCWLAAAVKLTGSTFAAMYIMQTDEDFYTGDMTIIIGPNWKGDPRWN